MTSPVRVVQFSNLTLYKLLDYESKVPIWFITMQWQSQHKRLVVYAFYLSHQFIWTHQLSLGYVANSLSLSLKCSDIYELDFCPVSGVWWYYKPAFLPFPVKLQASILLSLKCSAITSQLATICLKMQCHHKPVFFFLCNVLTLQADFYSLSEMQKHTGVEFPDSGNISYLTRDAPHWFDGGLTVATISVWTLKFEGRRW